MKACENCSNRVEIGKNHNQISVPRRALGLFFVYAPIITLPFVFASAYMTYFHLWLVGAKNIKKFTDYLPAKESHRYTMKNQITMKPSFGVSLSQYKLYWILNCTWYCPVSVAVFRVACVLGQTRRKLVVSVHPREKRRLRQRQNRQVILAYLRRRHRQIETQKTVITRSGMKIRTRMPSNPLAFRHG